MLRLRGRHGRLHARRDPDIYFTGPDGSLRSNRAFCQTAGLYACDMFIGSTLQIDLAGNTSTVTDSPHRGLRRRAEHGCRCPWTASSQRALAEGRARRPTRRTRASCAAAGSWSCRSARPSARRTSPTFVEKLDALELAEKLKLELAPVMIYGDDVTHIVTRGRDRQPAALPHGRRARTGRSAASPASPSRTRPGSQSGRAIARTRHHPPPRRPRHQSARCPPQHAGGALDQGSGALVGRSLRAAVEIPELVRSAIMENLNFQHTARGPARRHRRRRSSASWLPAIWKCWWSACCRTPNASWRSRPAAAASAGVGCRRRRLRRALFAGRPEISINDGGARPDTVSLAPGAGGASDRGGRPMTAPFKQPLQSAERVRTRASTKHRRGHVSSLLLDAGQLCRVHRTGDARVSPHLTNIRPSRAVR